MSGVINRNATPWENVTMDEPKSVALEGAGALTTLKSLALFFVGGLCEIGGGYLLWQWLRHGKPFWYALAGAVLLIL